MSDFKISFVGDESIQDVHHIGIDYNGNYYGVIFGRYINGGFCCIPSLETGCELSDFDDVFWNKESLTGALNDANLAQVVATAIKTYMTQK